MLLLSVKPSVFVSSFVYVLHSVTLDDQDADDTRVGFSTKRLADDAILSESCDNMTVMVSYIDFVCSEDSEWDTEYTNITEYLDAAFQDFDLPCSVSLKAIIPPPPSSIFSSYIIYI